MPTTFFTVIFFSQYLSECDQIILMKDGQIAECGTHDQLMCKERDYANLFNSLQQEVRPPQHSNWILLVNSWAQKDLEQEKGDDWACLSMVKARLIFNVFVFSDPG